jgi:hypothetical protein
MTRNKQQWLSAMQTDMNIIHDCVDQASDPEWVDPALKMASAIKESRRLTSDLYRYAEDILGLTRQEIDEQRV